MCPSGSICLGARVIHFYLPRNEWIICVLKWINLPGSQSDPLISRDEWTMCVLKWINLPGCQSDPLIHVLLHWYIKDVSLQICNFLWHLLYAVYIMWFFFLRLRRLAASSPTTTRPTCAGTSEDHKKKRCRQTNSKNVSGAIKL